MDYSNGGYFLLDFKETGLSITEPTAEKPTEIKDVPILIGCMKSIKDVKKPVLINNMEIEGGTTKAGYGIIYILNGVVSIYFDKYIITLNDTKDGIKITLLA